MKPTKTILVAEDEADLADLICFNLEREGYRCKRVLDGSSALVEIRDRPPDLVVLDRMLPGMSGDEVIKEIRKSQRAANIPIIMLTAKAEEADELVGFALGADDYVTKPFSMKRLLARVAAVMRRTQAPEETGDVLSAGGLTLDVTRHEVTMDGQPVALTATEFRILRTLMAASGRVLDREQLINAVLGPSVAVTDRTVDVHIAALRKKLGAGASWIQTIRGVGYAFRAPR